MVYSHWNFFQKLILTLFLTSLFSGAFAQKGSQIFLELGGFSRTYTANYSLKVSKKRNSHAYIRIGAALEENRLIAPIGFIYLRGNMDHYLELSTGLSFLSEGYTFWDREESDVFVNIVGGIAYRYQPFRQRYYVSIGLFPNIQWDPDPNSIRSMQFTPGFKPGFTLGYNIPY